MKFIPVFLKKTQIQEFYRVSYTMEGMELHEHDAILSLVFLLNNERKMKTLSPPVAFR